MKPGGIHYLIEGKLDVLKLENIYCNVMRCILNWPIHFEAFGANETKNDNNNNNNSSTYFSVSFPGFMIKLIRCNKSKIVIRFLNTEWCLFQVTRSSFSLPTPRRQFQFSVLWIENGIFLAKLSGYDCCEWRSVSCEAFDVISGSFELLFFLYKGSCSQNVSFSVANNKFQFTVTKQTT